MNRPRRAAFRIANALLLGDEDDVPPPANLFVDNESDDDIHDIGDDIASEASDDSIIDAGNLVDLDTDESTEESDSDNEDQQLAGMLSPSGLLWSQNPPVAVGRQPELNILRQRPGLKRGINPRNALDCFLIYMEDAFHECIQYTNLQGRRLVQQFNVQNQRRKVWKELTYEEFTAFVGLHVLAGAYKAQYRPLPELWSERDGHPIFRATMSLDRFYQLRAALRFDDPRRRNREDSLAPIRYVLETVNLKFRTVINPNENLTVDEQLLEYHGRVRFRQYIASKPGKYGIKIFWLCEASSGYCLNGLLYIGANTLTPAEIQQAQSIPEAVVMNLVRPFLNTGFNLVGDNWFTSYHLCNRLRDSRISYVGTVRRNKRELPPHSKSIANRERGDSKFYYHEGALLVSYWDKGRQPVLLFDTFSRVGAIDPATGKSETVIFYNKNKSGVDVLDKMVRHYSTKRKSSRWPVAVFMNLIDISLSNSTIVLAQLQNINEQQRKTFHYTVMKEVGYALVEGQVRRRRADHPNLHSNVRIAMSLCGFDQPNPIVQQQGGVKRRCTTCYTAGKKDRKTAYSCSSCGKPVCLEHASFKCKDCAN